MEEQENFRGIFDKEVEKIGYDRGEKAGKNDGYLPDQNGKKDL